MKFLNTVLIFALSVFLFTACQSAEQPKTDGDTKKDDAAKTETAKDEVKEVKWSNKEGEGGPENWAKLEMENNACGGKVQSPIDIVSKDAKPSEDLSAFKFAYGESDADIVNNGHTIQFNTTGENKVTIGEKEYKMLQFHYHAGSEHTVDGKQYPLEVHFVHKNTETDYAVLGVMFEEGAENALLAKYMKDFPAEKGEKKGEGKIDIASLFPKETGYYNYKGSLTTPPCSEVVNWYVMKKPVTASKEQLDSFAKMLDGNYRPVMPLEGREVNMFSE